MKSSHIDSCDLIEILNLLYPRVCDGNVKGDKTSSLLRQLIDSVSALDAVWCSLFMRQKSSIEDYCRLINANHKHEFIVLRQSLEKLTIGSLSNLSPYVNMSARLYMVYTYLEYQRRLRVAEIGVGENYTVEDVIRLKEIFHSLKCGELDGIRRVGSTNELSNSFDGLLKRYTKLNCMVFNIDFPFSADLQQGNEYEQSILKRLHIVNEFREKITSLQCLIAANTKVMPIVDGGLKLNVLLIFEVNSKVSIEKVSRELESMLKKLMLGKAFRIQDWGNFLEAKIVKREVAGEIHLDNERKIAKFKYWIISFIERLDEFLTFSYFSEEGKYPSNVIWYSPNCFLSGFPISAFQLIDRKRLINLIDEDERIWKVGHLPSILRKKLKVNYVFYTSLENEFSDFINYRELVERIDIFIATTMNTTTNAFQLPIRFGNWIYTPEEVEGAITRVGKQLLWICSQSDYLIILKNSPFIYKLSLDVQYFLKSDCWFWLKYRLQELTSDKEALVVNNALNELRKNYENDIKHSRLVVSVWKKNKNSDEDTCSIENYIDITQSESLSTSKLITTKNYIQDSYAKCELRHKNIESYLKRLKKADCAIFRINFHLKDLNLELSQQDFAKKVTDFLQRYRKSTPLSWLKGYFGIWREDFYGCSYLDMVIVFDAQKMSHLANIEEKIDGLWKKYIANKHQANVYVLPLMNCISDLNQKYLLIEIGDTKRWKLLQDYLIPYLSYIELFEMPKKRRVPKVLVKGHT
ncbi:hypothetical protein QZK43_18220, partial [Acinetobacter baumannii]|nr:hypothetical protein [Acinetobacter baumannii]